MFQLLIFFMLSSTLSPFSLIALTAGAPPGQSELQGKPQPEAVAIDASDNLVIWHLSRGQVRSGDQVLPLDALAAIVPALLAKGTPDVLIYPTRSATVQDIATVLEVLGARGVAKVRLIAGSQVGGG